MISDETYVTIRESCNFKSSDTWKNQTCCDSVDEVFSQYGKIDIYSIYTSVCFASTARSSNDQIQSLQERRVMKYKRSSKMVSKYTHIYKKSGNDKKYQLISFNQNHNYNSQDLPYHFGIIFE